MENKIYLDRYRVCLDEKGFARELSIGGASASAYQAEDTTTQREVVVQLFPAAGLPSSVREKIEAEALAARQIDHPNVVALCDFAFADGHFVYVTEYFDGTSAQAWMTEHGPMPVGAVLRIASQMVGALAAAAFHGIFHHAVNPENVILVPGQTPEGEWPLIKLANLLGVAPSFSAGTMSSARFDSSANFASPEQLQNAAVDFRSEIYSLGCTLWFLLSGVPPLAGAVTIKGAAGVPGVVKDLLASMLAVDPNQRPLDPIALQDEILQCIAQVDRRDAIASKFGVAPVTAAAAMEASPSRRSIPWKPLALAALLLVAATLIALVLPENLRPGRLFTRESAPIGVPVGVSEPARASESVATTQLPDVPEKTPESQDAAAPGVLTSTASADDPEESSEESPKVAENQAPSDVPEATTPPQEASLPSPPETIENASVAARTEEPPPPSEGPQDSGVAPVAPAQEATAQIEATDPAGVQDSEPPAPRPTPAIMSSPSAKSPIVARKTKQANKPKHYVTTTDSMPPLPPHSVRGRYLGTTPDGELILLPSGERVFVAPAVDRPEPPRRRRVFRLFRDPVPELPVLPALPPDD